MDIHLESDGPLVPVVGRDGERIAVRRQPFDTNRPGFVPHWDTCPDPDRWHEVRAAAASGLPTDRPRDAHPVGAAPRGESLGPCAGCYRPGHVAYGPACTGLLCDGCAAILAAWRAQGGAQCRTRLVYPRWKGGG